MKKNQKGFGVIEILVVIVAVGLVGAAGWLVYNLQNNKTDDKNKTAQTSQQDQGQETTEEGVEANNAIPQDYQVYTNSSARFSFNYPKDWSEVKSSLNEMTLAYVAPNGTEFPNVYVWVADIDNSSCDQTTSPVSKVTVAGIESEQYEGGTQTNKITTCIPKSGKIFHVVHAYTNKDYKVEYQKLLESFKFL